MNESEKKQFFTKNSLGNITKGKNVQNDSKRKVQ